MNITSTRNSTKPFTRDIVAAAPVAAGNNPQSTDADIRCLTNIQFHMIASGLQTLEREVLDDHALKLLDHFSA